MSSKKVEFSRDVQSYGSTENGEGVSSFEQSPSFGFNSTPATLTYGTLPSPSREYPYQVSYYGNGYDCYSEGSDDEQSGPFVAYPEIAVETDRYRLESDHLSELSDTSEFRNGRHTLYRSNSVSIVNCEYKLRERFPHFTYLFLFVSLYIALILFGTSMFVLFEANAEMRIRDQILLVQRQFLEAHPSVEPSELQRFVRAVIDAQEKGVSLALLNELIERKQSPKKEHSKDDSEDDDIEKLEEYLKDAGKVYSDKIREEIKKQREQQKTKDGQSDVRISTKSPEVQVPTELTNWEFMSSLTFVTTLVTTIGYGHVTPITPEGKILTIVFGVVAIPATLLFFSVLISTIRDGPIKWIEIMLIKFFSRFYHIHLLKIRFIHLVLVTILLFSFLILLPSFLFERLEPNWTFSDAFYFCFITITTVGLGDYVPAQSVEAMQMRSYYLVGTVVYMYIGLCMIMLWIALVLRIPHFNFKTFLVIEEPDIEEKKTRPRQNEKTPLLSG